MKEFHMKTKIRKGCRKSTNALATCKDFDRVLYTIYIFK